MRQLNTCYIALLLISANEVMAIIYIHLYYVENIDYIFRLVVLVDLSAPIWSSPAKQHSSHALAEVFHIQIFDFLNLVLMI